MKIQVNDINPQFSAIRPKKQLFSPNTISRIAYDLSLSREDVTAHTNNMTKKQFNLFNILAKGYNFLYNSTESKEKENPQLIFQIVESISSPKKIHEAIAFGAKCTFENLARIFESAKTKKELNFALNFDRTFFFYEKHAENLLPDILESPYKKEYIEHIDEYLIYLRMNKDNENAVKELDKMIAEGKYDKAYYYKKEHVDALRMDYPTENWIKPEDLDAYYSREGEKFLRNFGRLYNLPEKFSEAKMEDMTQIYKTFTEKNIDIRTDIITKFHPKLFYMEDIGEELHAMRSVFEKIDADKYTHKLVASMLKNVDSIGTIKSLEEILNNVSPRKGYIFRRNLNRIIKITKPGEERNAALQNELENPFFETDISKNFKRYTAKAIENGFGEKKSRFSKLFTKWENEFNKFRYSLIKDENPVIIESQKDIANDLNKVAENPNPEEVKEVNNIIEETKEAIETKKTKEAAEIKETAETAETPAAETQEPEFVKLPKLKRRFSKKTYETPAINFVNTVLSKAQKKKIEAQESVRKFIHEKLHPSIVKEHENIYTNKATKMRIKMLPEILASIKDTRAAQRAKGIKHPKISNYDAVDLYTRIDGRNRKLVNYMLKKRNPDGTRMFNINDIMDELLVSHKKIILERLKPAEAKALYEEAYQNKLNEYGKI